jgi:hypothetical protein
MEKKKVWWQDLLWGWWNGFSAWVVLIVHIFGGWAEYPLYNATRDGNWYAVGFLIGSGSPFLGVLGGNRSRTSQRAAE